MGKYIARRLLAIPPLLVGVTLITFAIVHLTPGSPVDDLRLSVPGMREADARRIERTLGLDKPLHEQYLGWLGALVQGDLGISMTTYRPVRTQIVERLPNTLILTASALVVALVIAIPVGMLAAVRRNSPFDQIANATAAIGSALPTFWVGLLLILFFSVEASSWHLPTLPSGGTRSFPDGGDFGDRLTHLILPVIALSLGRVAEWTRYVRGQLLEVLGQDYVRTARSKGLRERAVLLGHAFRNSLLPLVTLVGLSLPNLFSGAVIVEAIFSWPGIGNLSLEAAARHDYTLIMGLVVFIAALTLVANLVTDIVYVVIDPRIKLGG